ncbi:MAG: leucine-rich repeat domain-containing protein [Clostridia bacterium]|nr:leucine-rich repeat domain-containing protein [Clostridia bacterium]
MMKNKKKRRLRGALIVLCVLIALGAEGLFLRAQLFVRSGNCGVEGAEDSVVWRVDLRGRLTISGNGEMADNLNYLLIFAYESAFHTSVNFENAIRSVVVEEGVTRIGDNAFAGLFHVGTVSLPESLGEIGFRAFGGLSRVKTVRLPARTESVGTEAFAGCYALREIAVDENNPSFTSADGVLMNRGKTELLAFPAGRTDKEYVVPDSVARIGDSAFCCCANLMRVEIPDTVTEIGKNAFDNCSRLENVRLPATLTELDDYTFVNCTALREIELPDTVTKCGNSVFQGCSSLSSVKLPDGLDTVAGLMFEECAALRSIELPAGIRTVATEAFALSGLEEIVLPEGVTTVGMRAFYGCESLRKITIPASVTKIGKSAFAGCPDLTSIDYAGTEEQWQKAAGGEDVGFDKF